jgi:hypothetical protein
MLVANRVRKATQDDADDIYAMLCEMHRENGMFTMSAPRVREILARAFNRGGAVIGVIGPKGKLEASICLLITNIWYSDDFHLEEFWNFVRPDFRKSNNAKELISFAKRCGDEINLPVFIGIMSSIRTQAKIDLYKRQLGDPIGAFFIHQPRRAA